MRVPFGIKSNECLRDLMSLAQAVSAVAHPEVIRVSKAVEFISRGLRVAGEKFIEQEAVRRPDARYSRGGCGGPR